MIDAVDAIVGGGAVRRSLPTRAKRTIGAWCFLDHFGPSDITGQAGMAVGPHPHTGLQTVTWLLEGEVVHRDSLGSEQAIRPGQLNVMTAGRGVAHAEESPSSHPPILHGTQLWVALPDGQRDREPAFDHHPELPATNAGDWSGRVLVGSFGGVTSPAKVYSPLVGVELTTSKQASAELALDPAFEHGVLVVEGAAAVGGADAVGPDRLVVLPPGRSSLDLAADGPARVLLLGGAPWEGPLVMWWNFVGDSAESVERARADWQAGRRFGATPFLEVPGATARRIPAPPLPFGRLVSRT